MRSARSGPCLAAPRSGCHQTATQWRYLDEAEPAWRGAGETGCRRLPKASQTRCLRACTTHAYDETSYGSGGLDERWAKAAAHREKGVDSVGGRPYKTPMSGRRWRRPLPSKEANTSEKPRSSQGNPDGVSIWRLRSRLPGSQEVNAVSMMRSLTSQSKEGKRRRRRPGGFRFHAQHGRDYRDSGDTAFQANHQIHAWGRP
jgi:hypothetical protein